MPNGGGPSAPNSLTTLPTFASTWTRRREEPRWRTFATTSPHCPAATQIGEHRPMEPRIHERQYEFAVNFELTTALGAIPIIPSTKAEAKLGWDAKFDLGTGWLYHLQYKVASYAS